MLNVINIILDVLDPRRQPKLHLPKLPGRPGDDEFPWWMWQV